VRDKSIVILIAVLSAFAISGLVAVVVSGGGSSLDDRPTLVRSSRDPGSAFPATDPVTSAEWLASMRPYCNPVDVETRLSWSPAPEGAEGTMHEAACLALAGRTDDARARLLTLSAQDRWKGAGIVFEVGHPAADAGDDVELLRAAGEGIPVPVVASGGLGQPEHAIQAVTEGGVDAVAMADVFHYERLDVGDIRRALRGAGIEVRCVR
jgi:imidazole glycerol phosphate synthase subunit HisF